MANTSIVDYLNSQGQASDFSTRAKLASDNGITGYTGSAQQNLSLLSTLQNKKTTTSTVPANDTSSNDNTNLDEVIGAGPNAGMTQRQLQQMESDPNYVAPTYNTTDTSAKQAPGESNADFATRIKNQPFYLADYVNTAPVKDPGLGYDDVKGVLSGMGLSGSGVDASHYVGMTRGQVQAQLQAKKDAISGQQSDKTSYSFNPLTNTNASKILEGFNTKLNSAKNDPFSGNGTKTDLVKGTLESTANDFAKLFSSVDAFNTELKNNPQFQNTINSFIQQGGDINSIASRITAPTTVSVVSTKDNPDGTTTNILSDGSTSTVKYTQNEDGSLTPVEVPDNNQSLSTYLEALSPNATPAQKEAFTSMIPEKQLAQEQIAQIAQIPKEYKDLYFGTPEQVGLLEEKRILAETRKQSLETKAQNTENDARTSAQIAIDKNNADLEIENAKVEENRLKAKNYMTGMLAKMGALNTTGSAVESLGVLDTQYQKQASENRMKISMANTEISQKLTETVHGIESDKEDAIYNLQSDLTKSKEQVIKDGFKLETDAQKQISAVMSKYTTALRVQMDKYTTQAKKDADAYAKAYAKTVTKYNLNSIANSITSTKGKASFKSSWTPQLEASRGPDGYVDSSVYTKAFNAWNDKKGSIKDFKLLFPPADYINPANVDVIPAFRTTPKKTAKGRELPS